MRQQPLQRDPRRAVTRIAEHLERREILGGHDLQEVLHEVVIAIEVAPRPGAFAPPILLEGRLLDIVQPGVAGDRTALRAHELQPVVLRRVVARGDHAPAVEAVVRGGEVHHLAAHHPEVHHVTPASFSPRAKPS